MEQLSTMSIQDLECYNNLIKQQIDSTVIKLKMQLPNEEYRRINNERLKYNHIWDAILKEINKRIFNIEVE